MEHGRHQLAEGDVIRLGRFKFRVTQLAVKAAADGLTPHPELDEAGRSCGSADFDKARSWPTCRICLTEGHAEDDRLIEEGGVEKRLTEEDPLIAPCKCKGSMRHVHRGCLRQWIRGRLLLPETCSGSFFYRALPCEVCHASYPSYFVGRGGERSALMDLPTTQAPFIVLENMVKGSQQHTSRGFHVISLADKPLRLGRGHESDVRIADVSISRDHALISFQEGQFLMHDNNSKFGTFVALKKPQLLRKGSPLSLQMGSTVLRISADSNEAALVPQTAPVGTRSSGSTVAAPGTDDCS